MQQIGKLVTQIGSILLVFYLISRIFGLVGIIVALVLMFVYRLIRIFIKGDKILKNLGSLVISIAYVSAIVIVTMRRDWFGLWGLLLHFILLLAWRLKNLIKGWKGLKEQMVIQCKVFEKQQLGYDLDDDYWKTHKKPTKKELISGTYVPKDLEGNIIENEN